MSTVGIKCEEFWAMLKKLALIYYDFLGHILDENVEPSQQKQHDIKEIAGID